MLKQCSKMFAAIFAVLAYLIPAGSLPTQGLDRTVYIRRQTRMYPVTVENRRYGRADSHARWHAVPGKQRPSEEEEYVHHAQGPCDQNLSHGLKSISRTSGLLVFLLGLSLSGLDCLSCEFVWRQGFCVLSLE
jgi:hypothetical protein